MHRLFLFFLLSTLTVACDCPPPVRPTFYFIDRDVFFEKTGIIEKGRVSTEELGLITKSEIFRLDAYDSVRHGVNISLMRDQVIDGKPKLCTYPDIPMSILNDPLNYGEKYIKPDGCEGRYVFGGLTPGCLNSTKDNVIDVSNLNHWYLHYEDSWWLWDVSALNINYDNFLANSGLICWEK